MFTVGGNRILCIFISGFRMRIMEATTRNTGLLDHTCENRLYESGLYGMELVSIGIPVIGIQVHRS